jgi:hypothetical protein
MLSCRLQRASALPLTTHGLAPTSGVLSSRLKKQRKKKTNENEKCGMCWQVGERKEKKEKKK